MTGVLFHTIVFFVWRKFDPFVDLKSIFPLENFIAQLRCRLRSGWSSDGSEHVYVIDQNNHRFWFQRNYMGQLFLPLVNGPFFQFKQNVLPVICTPLQLDLPQVKLCIYTGMLLFGIAFVLDWSCWRRKVREYYYYRKRGFGCGLVSF